MHRRFPRYGASMGITALIPDMTIGQLTTEAVSRWGEIWDEKAARMLVLLMCPRTVSYTHLTLPTILLV